MSATSDKERLIQLETENTDQARQIRVLEAENKALLNQNEDLKREVARITLCSRFLLFSVAQLFILIFIIVITSF